MRFPTAAGWTAHLRRLVLDDYDNVTLFTGPEGRGKSTHAFQIGRAVDPSFGPHRVAFDIPSFLEIATEAEPGQAVLLDEAPLNRRRVMKRDAVAFLEWLQVCRSRRLHQLLCFPHLTLMDDAVKTTRIRYRVHVKARGRAVLHRPKVHVWKSRSGEETLRVDWPSAGAWRFVENSGPTWAEYRRLKKLADGGAKDFVAASRPKASAGARKSTGKRKAVARSPGGVVSDWEEVLRDVRPVDLGRRRDGVGVPSDAAEAGEDFDGMP